MDPDDLKPAPEPLRLLQRFVNTRRLMRGYDLLDSSGSFEKWLVGLGYGPPEGELTGEELGHLRVLREDLREVLAAHNLKEAPQIAQTEQAISELNRSLESEALGIQFAPSGQPQLVTSSTGVEGLIGDIMAAAIWARHTGIWQRLKVCANEECRWAFYDSSKPRSGSWCDMDICGSRAKMRAYRKRQGSSTS